MKTTLAQLLTLRKELQAKVTRMEAINRRDVYEIRVERVKVSEGVDEVKAAVPKVAWQQFEHAYNWHARMLRTVDDAIQRTNHQTEVEVPDGTMDLYVDPFVKVEDVEAVEV